MNTSALFEDQFLATKFYVPVVQGTIISRPRLSTLLAESFRYPLTLISAPAGFGKTTLLSTWVQSYRAGRSLLAWVSLDQEDNEPQLFWAYVLSALNKQQPKRFTSLLMQLQSPQGQSLKHILTGFINLLVESWEHFVLILDDYHVITQQEIHSSFSYLVEHLPPQLSIILATRADPPLPLSQLRARQQILEVRADQLRCTAEETRAFFHEVMDIQLPDETIQQVTVRSEGWLVGLQLLGLSLSEQTNSDTLLEISGDQRYILDYLTEIVLQQQPPEIQNFLLSTCILERFTGSLCDAVMEQTGSWLLLQRIEQANLFVVSLDNKREWYRYHVLFAEALRYRLEQASGDLVLTLHHRASLWYAQHDQATQAILHALHAKEWLWAAHLIEHKSLALNALSWGVSHHQLLLLRDWLIQIPADLVSSCPRLSLTRIWMLFFITPETVLDIWLSAVETTLTKALIQPSHQENASAMLISQARQEQENLLGETIVYRALLQSHRKDGETVLPLCQQAQALLSADNAGAHAHIAVTQLFAFYSSSINDATAAIQIGLQAGSLSLTTNNIDQAVSIMGLTAMHMIGAGRLHDAQRLAQQAILLESKPRASVLPRIGWPTIWQAEILRERNELDAAHSCVEEAIKLCQQMEWAISLIHVLQGYTIQLRVSLSRRDYDAAYSALQEIEHIGIYMHHTYAYHCSHFATIDKVRLWLACGELERATRWAEELDMTERHLTPFAHEREGVACARIFLAKDQPTQALQRLEPVLQRASAGQRWGHVIEIRLLQALAYQMLQEEAQALDVLSEAIKLAEPEGYIRSFVDEGTSMEALLYRLRKQNRKQGPTPYLDRLLAAFQQESSARMWPRGQTQTQSLPDPLSQREREVLQLIAQGASNQEIGQELVIVIDTVKRHISHIFAKLGVQNRVQAVRQAQELGLLDEEG